MEHMQLSQAEQDAMEWFLKLSSGDASSADYVAFEQWQSANSLHTNAWQKIERVTKNFKTAASHQEITQTLKQLYQAPPSKSRRQALKQMGVLLGFSLLGYAAYREQPWQPMLADYHTPTGKQQQLTLQDGTKLTLNTATSVDVEYTDTQRLIKLIEGEVYIETAHEAGGNDRPLLVKTSFGLVQALGTRFTVRQFNEFTQVSVFEGAVKVSPNQSETNLVLQAGESIQFNQAKLLQKSAADISQYAWIKGYFVADNMDLKDLIHELSRYRTGLLKCSDAVAQTKISGSFPIHNTDKALSLLTDKFPLKVQNFTRFLTIISPA